MSPRSHVHCVVLVSTDPNECKLKKRHTVRENSAKLSKDSLIAGQNLNDFSFPIILVVMAWIIVPVLLIYNCLMDPHSVWC